MDAFQALLHMGGYGGYVWPAYGLSVVVMVGLLLASAREAKAREAELDLLQKARGRRRNGNPESKA